MTSRNQLLESSDISERITGIRAEVINGFITSTSRLKVWKSQWDIDGLQKALAAELQLELPIKQWLADETDLDEGKLRAAHHRSRQSPVSGQNCGRRAAGDAPI